MGLKISTKQKIEEFLLAPIARQFDVEPNYITLGSIAFMAVAGYLVIRGLLANAAVFFVASCLCDSLDGVAARIQGRATAFGAFFDRTADRVNDAMIMASIVVAGFVQPAIGMAAIISVMIASYMSAVLEGSTSSRVGERLSLRYVRMPVLLAGLIIPHPQALYVAMLVVLATGLFGIVTRSAAAWRLLPRKRKR
jgi:CDP-diacylglycerol--glycerol-3-phosphate 3-phosphatidyltransferase